MLKKKRSRWNATRTSRLRGLRDWFESLRPGKRRRLACITSEDELSSEDAGEPPALPGCGGLRETIGNRADQNQTDTKSAASDYALSVAARPSQKLLRSRDRLHRRAGVS